MGEGKSIHNLCRIADKKKQLPTGEFHDVNLWISTFHGAFNRKATTQYPRGTQAQEICRMTVQNQPKGDI
jgi:hypothetical protein